MSPAVAATATSVANNRLASLDQFRGYTVLGMFLVNYFGSYAVCPQWLKHSHDYCSYADTIMPQFLFAVGFALRLTFGRRVEVQGRASAYGRMIRRLLGLVLVSLVVYTATPRAISWNQLSQMGVLEILHEPLKRTWFQTLMHIAVTSLWILPVVRCAPAIRVMWMFGSAIAHVVLSDAFNFTWVNTSPYGIDGGPLGFLTWSIPAIVGTLACDGFAAARERSWEAWSAVVQRTLLAALLLMFSGYVMSCATRLYDVPPQKVAELRNEKLAADPVLPNQERIELHRSKPDWSAWLAEPPMVKPPDASLRKWNYWMMSQRGGTLSYLTFASGVSLAVFLVFFIACDLFGRQSRLLRTFGTNALVAYVLHDWVASAVQPFFPLDSPTWYALSGLFIYLLITWLFVRHLEKQGLYLRA